MRLSLSYPFLAFLLIIPSMQTFVLQELPPDLAQINRNFKAIKDPKHYVFDYQVNKFSSPIKIHKYRE